MTLQKLGPAIAAAAAAWIVATTLYAVHANHVPIPYQDEWGSVSPETIWAQLFAQHAEHRIVLPRLVFLSDLSLAAGTGLLTLVAAQLVQAGHVVALSALVRAVEKRSTLLWCACIVTALLFSALQLDNLQIGFQVQFVAVYAFGTLAFLVLAASPTWLGVIVAAVLGAAASLCMANGLLVPPLLAGMAAWLGRSWKQTALLAAAAGVMWCIYLHGYEAIPQHGSVRALLSTPWRALVYWPTVIGGAPARIVSMLSGAGSYRALAIAFGLGGGAVLAWSLVRHVRGAAPASLAVLFVMLFTFGSAGAIALGRAAMDTHQDYVSRYGTPSLIFWSAAVLAGMLATNRQHVVLHVATAATIALAVAQPRLLRPAELARNHRVLAVTAILARADDHEALQHLHPWPEFVVEQSRILRERHAGIFRQPWAHWLDRDIAAETTIDKSSRCVGTLDEARRVAGAWRAHGWAWDPTGATLPDAIVITSATGKIIGFGLPGARRSDVREARRDVRSSYAGWTGHFVADSKDSIIVYALTMRGGADPQARPWACRLGVESGLAQPVR